jgi:cation diffusion facilitator family transporter
MVFVSQTARLSWVLLLNVLLIGGLVVAGLAADSLGVLAAAADTAADSTAIGLGLLAIWLRDRHGKPSAPTYVAGVNALLLLTSSVVICAEAIDRLVTASPEVRGLPTLIAAAVALSVLVVCGVILGRGAAGEDLHMRSVLLDTLADAVSAAGVAVVGAIILLTGRWFWLDSVVAIAIGVVVIGGAVHLLVEVASTLRQDKPLSFDEV